LILDHLDGNHGELYPRSHEFKSHGVPYIGANDFANGDVTFDPCKFLAPERAGQFRKGVAKDGDVLFAHNATVGPVALLRTEEPFVILSTTATYFRCDLDKLNNSYLNAALQSQHFVRQYQAVMAQSTRFQVPITTQRKLSLVIAPLPEQGAIATVLSDVDALLGGLDRLIAKKRDLKQATMQQLLSGQTRLPGFNGEWETLPARDIGVFKGGSGFPLAAQGEAGGEYPFFKVSDMNNEGNETVMTTANHYVSEHARKRLGATAFPADSIVFAKVGAAVFLERKKILGQASCIDNNMAAFVLNKSRAEVGYVHALLLSKKLGALVATTALPALNAKQFGGMPLAIPPLPEQRAIAVVLSDMDAELSALEARRDKTRALKQAMMQELLTGRTRLANG